ncbi:MAG: hypothetical protein E7478_00410 [Ruminococcaceae bacterium]|nr:hypothetical protein [Oscillospiraceae bacterium]
MKNIYIGYISVFRTNENDTAEITYSLSLSGRADRINAKLSNEACCKAAINNIALNKQAEKLDMAICIISPGVQTVQSSYNYFKKRISEYHKEVTSDIEICSVNISDSDEQNNVFSSTLKAISDKITEFAQANDEDIAIHLDISGGKRNAVILIQLLTKCLSYYGYKTHAYYAELTGTNEGRVVSCDTSYRQMDILDSVNEFLSHGNAFPLHKTLYSGINHRTDILIKAMYDISETITLCRTKELPEKMQRLHSAVTNYRNTAGQSHITDDELMIYILLPLIEKKFFNGEGEPDLCRVIRWCIDNGLIQQALTIYAQLIPKYIFDKGLIANARLLLQAVAERNNNREDYFEALTELTITEDNDRRNQLSRLRNVRYIGENELPYRAVLGVDRTTVQHVIADVMLIKKIRHCVSHADTAINANQAYCTYAFDTYGYKTYQNNGFTISNIIEDVCRALDRLEAAVTEMAD